VHLLVTVTVGMCIVSTQVKLLCQCMCCESNN